MEAFGSEMGLSPGAILVPVHRTPRSEREDPCLKLSRMAFDVEVAEPHSAKLAYPGAKNKGAARKRPPERDDHGCHASRICSLDTLSSVEEVPIPFSGLPQIAGH